MSSSPQPPAPAGMHPRHPGVGSSTSLIRLEGDDPEVGGFLIFYPSGKHMTISWRVVKHIEPTKEAALQFVGKIVDDLNKAAAQGTPEDRQAAEQDLKRTNWVSVTAAVQRVILDFNSELSNRISLKMAAEFGGTWPSNALPKPH